MRAMQLSGVDSVQKKIGRWIPSDLAYIEQLELTTADEDGTSTLKVRALFQRRDKVPSGWPSNTEPFFKLQLTFFGVRELMIKRFGGGRMQLMGFDIHEIADRGLEGLGFEVEDYESDDFSFRCAAIDIEMLEG